LQDRRYARKVVLVPFSLLPERIESFWNHLGRISGGSGQPGPLIHADPS
jgi:hypothetical protein